MMNSKLCMVAVLTLLSSTALADQRSALAAIQKYVAIENTISPLCKSERNLNMLIDLYQKGVVAQQRRLNAKNFFDGVESRAKMFLEYQLSSRCKLKNK